MENFGAWGLIPPLLTIVLAFITKDVIVALFLGIFSGSLIVAGGNPIVAILNLTDSIAASLSDGWNIRIILFCALLGGLVGMLKRTGAARAFGQWAATKLHSKRTSLLMTWFCGIIIFIDDYFNSLAVGTVMRPITDKYGVPRAKLAYILDSTAAPVCILVPISSWVITVMSLIKGAEGFSSLNISEFEFFMRSVPYNIYAILTLIMVGTIIITGIDFGSMKKSIEYAKTTGKLFNEDFGPAPGEIKLEGDDLSFKAKPLDMLFPIILLIISALIMFPMTTWLSSIDGESIINVSEAMKAISVGQAFNNTDAAAALFYAIVITIVISYIYYVIRGLFNIKSASDSFIEGVESMMPALIILTMAWTIGGIIKYSPSDGGLGLASYLSEVVVGGGFPLAFVPMIVFALSALIAFSTGTSWGTFAIMIPIVMPIIIGLSQASAIDPTHMLNSSLFSISAVLGGAVFGDHASPISDTTILSSTGGGCPHLEHVSTQLPYAITVATCSFIGYMVGGLFNMNIVISWIVSLIFFVLALIILPKKLS